MNDACPLCGERRHVVEREECSVVWHCATCGFAREQIDDDPIRRGLMEEWR
jgi:ribosomal protein L37AE/L43A